MRRALLAAAAAPALLGTPATAFAQAVVVESPAVVYVVPPAPPVRYYSVPSYYPPAPPVRYYSAPSYYPPAPPVRYYSAPPPSPPRTVRYYRYDAYPDEEIVVVRPRVRACGPNAYWDGGSCVYAGW